MIHVKLFSHLEICLPDSTTQRLQTRKTGLLLAYLVCFPDRSHLRSHLATLLWPDADPSAARASLRTSLNSLRDSFHAWCAPAEALVATPQAIRLRSDLLTSDVSAFREAIRRAGSGTRHERTQALKAAVALYRGPLLPEIAEEWVERERALLAAQCREALGRLTAWSREDNALSAALDYARQGVTLDPEDPDAHLRVMQILFESEQFEQVVREYAGLARRLKKSDLPPPPEARELRRRAVAAAKERAKGVGLTARRESALLPGNVHAGLNLFWGREGELKPLRSMLERPLPRLITLTGFGGSGKTRLAREAALRSNDLFEGRIYWTDMAEIDSADRIIAHVARSILNGSTRATDPLAHLQRALGERRLLLVLDNFELLAEVAATSMTTLLRGLPGLKVLVASRQRLQMQGEQVFPVSPLPVPGDDRRMEIVGACDSVRLFLDRAQAIRPTFALTEENASAVAALCRALEGIPLALEIAAAWNDVLSPATMLQGIERRFDMLIHPLPDVPARHASLWNAIEWSYRQLTPPLQRLFTALSLFRGGWTREAMEAVCPEEGTAAALRQLQERSLVTMREVEGEPRFYFLDTLREFAARQLTGNARDLLRRRHAAYFLRFTLAVQNHLRSSLLPQWLERLAQEHDNLLLALETWEVVDRYDQLLRMAAGLRYYWVARDQGPIGFAILQKGLETYSAQDVIRADALRAAIICEDMRNTVRCRAWALESLRITEALDDKARTADGLTMLARVQDPADLGLIERALSLYREAGDFHGEANCLHMIGGIHFLNYDLDSAEPVLEAAARLRLSLGDKRGLIFTLQYLGNIYLHRAEYTPAERAYRDGLALAQELKNRFAEGLAFTMLGYVDYFRGSYTDARRLVEQGLSILQEAYVPTYETTTFSLLAQIAYAEADYPAAHAAIREAVRCLLTQSPLSALYTRLGAHALRIAVLALPERSDVTWRLWQTAEAAYREQSIRLQPHERKELEAGRTLLEAGLGAETLVALLKETQALTVRAALELLSTL